MDTCCRPFYRVPRAEIGGAAMTITPEQLKALELAHDEVRDYTEILIRAIIKNLNAPDSTFAPARDALDTLTAAIEALKEGK